MRQILLPFLMALCISACSASESNMNQNPSDAGLHPVEKDKGLAKLNPHPQRAYELTVALENAPGPFAFAEGRAQYDVVNEDQCGHVNPLSGTAERITSFESVALTKVSDTEYRGTVYVDLMQDEDYYGRGVCQWELQAVRANLRATGADGETWFGPAISFEQIVAGEPVELYFWKGRYPRSEMDNYPESGRERPDEFRPEIRDELFKVTLQAQGPQP